MRISGAIGTLCLLHTASFAWNLPVHARLTRVALASLPERMQQPWAAVADRLAREYSMYPDRMAGATEPDFSALAPYCLKPDGKPIHNITWQPEDDLRSLAYSMNGIIAAMRAGRAGRAEEAAKHAGVLAHFLEDSTCPAHALIPADSPLRSLRERLATPGKEDIPLHATIERSAPLFDLAGRAPQQAGSSLDQATRLLLERCYVVVRHNRENLEELVRAVYAGDEAALDSARLEAARRGAALVADAWYTALLMAGEPERRAGP
jgi:hypothetical protein